MREAIGKEPQCVMREQCECMFIDRNTPFIGASFWVPGTTAHLAGMCVLCCRKTTQKLFYDMVYQKVRVRAVIQAYGNICNAPGEYARECMLVCPANSFVENMPLPIMSHQRNRYTVHMVAGVRSLRQHGVQFESFPAVGEAEAAKPGKGRKADAAKGEGFRRPSKSD